MRRERRKALGDALFVSDICIHGVEEGHFAAFGGGQMQPGLGHGREESAGLERHGLAARVGARDDERRKILSHPKRDGHDLLFVDQGMPAFADDQGAVRVVDDGGHARHLV